MHTSAFKSAVTGSTAKVVKVTGLISLSGQVDVGSNAGRRRCGSTTTPSRPTATTAKDHYDGLVDITHASDYVTVPRNTFKNHYKGSLVGHSDYNASEDTGHLR